MADITLRPFATVPESDVGPGLERLVPSSSILGCSALAAHALGLTRAMAALNGTCGCLLTFHRAIEAGAWDSLPNREFYLDADFLRRLLEHLQATGWDIVTMDEALRRAAARDGRRFVNISVDDTYRDTFDCVVPIFRRAGVPVTLFVTTGIPDSTLPLWAAGLENILAESSSVAIPKGDAAITLVLTDAAQRRRVFQEITAAWDQAGPEACYARFCALNGKDPAVLDRQHAMSWDMLATLRHDPHVEIGAHTVRHPHVAALPPAEAMAEIDGSRRRLQSMLGLPVRHFAFPYGRAADCGPRDFAMVRDAGFSSAATTRKGLVRFGPAFDPYALPRNTLNGAHRRISQVDFHLSGLSGLATRLLRSG